MENRRYQVFASEHILILQLPAFFVIRELVEHGTDQRRTVFGCLVIQLFDVIVHADADVVIFFHDPVIFFSIAPQFIGLAGIQVAAAKITVIERWNVVRSAVAVHTENSRVNGKLIPADQKLLEIRVVDIICHKAADIGCPPWNAGKTHIKAGLELIIEGFKGTRHIAGPYNISVFLASGPGAAKQVYNIFFSFCFHAVIEDTAVQLRIDIAAGKSRSVDIAVMIEIVNAEIRF